MPTATQTGETSANFSLPCIHLLPYYLGLSVSSTSSDLGRPNINIPTTDLRLPNSLCCSRRLYFAWSSENAAIGNNIPGIDDIDHLSERRNIESRGENGN